MQLRKCGCTQFSGKSELTTRCDYVVLVYCLVRAGKFGYTSQEIKTQPLPQAFIQQRKPIYCGIIVGLKGIVLLLTN